GNWLGILLIVVGVVFIDLTVHNNNGGVEGAASRRGLVFPVVGGVMLGVSSIIRKAALEVCDAPVFGVAVAYALSLVVYLLFLVFSAQTRRALEFKQNFRWFWVAGVGQAVTWILAFYALSFEQVSIITPLLSVEPLFVVVFAYFYLKKVEKVSLQLLASVALTILGVALVTL
ncbi:MAG: EamA family transporter, partial [Candidatus Bathyarchaeia archaeon]